MLRSGSTVIPPYDAVARSWSAASSPFVCTIEAGSKIKKVALFCHILPILINAVSSRSFGMVQDCMDRERASQSWLALAAALLLLIAWQMRLPSPIQTFLLAHFSQPRAQVSWHTRLTLSLTPLPPFPRLAKLGLLCAWSPRAHVRSIDSCCRVH